MFRLLLLVDDDSEPTSRVAIWDLGPTRRCHGADAATGRSAEDDPDAMCLAVVGEHDPALADEGHAVHLHGRHSPRHAAWILHADVIARGAMAEHQVEAWPRPRDTRIDHEMRAAQPEP